MVCADIGKFRWKPKLAFNCQPWRTVWRDVQNYQWNTKTCALWHLVKIKFLLLDVQRDLQKMELSDSSLIASLNLIEITDHTNDIDELTLFGVVSTSENDAESIDSELVRELERQVDDVFDESIESMCKEKGSGKIEQYNDDHDLQIAEVAQTKQTVRKQPTGLPKATVADMSSNPPSGGKPSVGGGGNPPASGGSGSSTSGGGGKAPRQIIAIKQPRKVPVHGERH